MLDILFNAFIVQCFTYCLFLFTNDGMIFSKYGEWLEMKRDEWENKSNAPFWGDPLLGCFICTNVWIAFSSYFFLYGQFSLITLVAHVFISTYMVYRLNKTL